MSRFGLEGISWSFVKKVVLLVAFLDFLDRHFWTDHINGTKYLVELSVV